MTPLDDWPDVPVRVKFWVCPIEGHRSGRVEWDGEVARCLFPGCYRYSTDPVPRRECLCEEHDCTGQCCGPGQCSCSPGR